MKNKNIAILIPTYNESKNIENIVKAISLISKDYKIIFIDDDSKDGTKEILEKLSKKHNVSYFIRKNKRGYGSALKLGFEKARNFDIIVTMDADFSHNPKDIPRLIREIEKGKDIVIGSRYVKSGKIKNWPILRKITSRFTNSFVRFFLRTEINDNTSGFRAYNNSFLKRINSFSSEGYSILEEILFLARKNNAKISEIPIEFKNREMGKSKANMLKEASRLFSLVIKLRKRIIKKFMKYCLVGLTGIVVNEGLLYILTENAGLHYLLSGAIAIEMSIISNFILNDLWTFKNNRHGHYLKRMLRFNFARILTAIINFVFLFGLTYIGINYLISNLIGIAIATVLGFELSVKWVWKK